MPNGEHPDATALPLESLVAVGDGAPSLELKLELLREVRRLRARAPLDEYLVRHADRVGRAVVAAEAAQQELRGIVDRLVAPPWHPAIFLRRLDGTPPRALVMQGGGVRVVSCASGLDVAALAVGEDVFLDKDASVILDRAPTLLRCGETATFERETGDGRLVLAWRDEEIIVDAADSLRALPLARGDRLRWDRAAWLAFERLAPDPTPRLLLDDVDDVGRDQVGGQDEALDRLLGALTARLVHPELAARYRLGARQSILMIGPPGCGKTLMARVAAAEVRRLSGRRCRFAVVKPAEWESELVGATQSAIRRTFAELREAAAVGFAVLFLDEIEAVGRIRGAVANHFADKFLAALLAELDGISDRGAVAIVAATNRKDLVDPALLERLSDVEVAVDRPRMAAARAIFAIHLPDDLPYRDERAAIIDAAVTRFYAPNGGGELCTLRLRDGSARTVTARDLASGRTFEQICRAARRAAFVRQVRGGPAGLGVADVEEAVADALERLATTITSRNAREYLPGLPQDLDVVSVDLVPRRPARPHRYVSAA